MRSSGSTTAWALLLGAFTVAPGCGFAPAEPEPEDVTPLVLLAVVEAGDSVHWAWLRGFGRPLLGAGSRMVVAHAGTVQASESRTATGPCGAPRGGHGDVGTHVCHEYALGVQPGDDVGIEAWAPGLDTVRGRARVPGAFEVTSVAGGSSTPSAGWRVSWTPSAWAASYLVEVRDGATCYPELPCAVLQAIRTTEHSVVLSPVAAAEDARLSVTVSALDPNLDAFATTGVPGGTFSKLPLSSVEGGIGVVGSLTRGTPRYLYLGGEP